MTPMIVEHPLLQHKLSILRNKQTGTKEFRDLVGEIATLLCYEATRDLPMEEVEIETPITMAKTKVLAGRKLALVPILRAGMGMLDGMLTLLPAAKVGFIGLYRNEETLQPVEYFCKLPQDIAERDVLVLDPMLATGGSAIDAITQIKKHGAKRIKFIGLIAAPEGIEALHKAHPDVDIYLGAKDDHLNENGYIVPGLGDAGDRLHRIRWNIIADQSALPGHRQGAFVAVWFYGVLTSDEHCAEVCTGDHAGVAGQPAGLDVGFGGDVLGLALGQHLIRNLQRDAGVGDVDVDGIALLDEAVGAAGSGLRAGGAPQEAPTAVIGRVLQASAARGGFGAVQDLDLAFAASPAYRVGSRRWPSPRC